MDSPLTTLPPPNRQPVGASVVTTLIAGQFPQWSELPVRPVERQGWDNCTFRLGDEMSVRLPTAAEYAEAVQKEHRWLPVLAPALTVPIPVPVGKGMPTDDYPHPWSVYQWLGGEPAHRAAINDEAAFADDLGAFLEALRQVDSEDGPEPGVHNWFRGGPLTTFDHWTQEALEILDGTIPTDLAAAIWSRALRAEWTGDPVWIHGDVAPGNLLLDDGKLAAVIDFGTCGVGDPACDLAIAWDLMSATGRQVFRARLGVDQATWERGQGWALWYALKNLAVAVRDGETPPPDATYTLDQLFADAGEAS